VSKSLLSQTKLDHDNLIAGDFHAVMDKVVVKAGSAYRRGTVVGLLSTDEKAVAIDSTKTDGSERPYGILADDIDATDSDMEAVVYVTGEFNENRLIFGGTDKAETHKKALREMGIFLRKAMK